MVRRRWYIEDIQWLLAELNWILFKVKEFLGRAPEWIQGGSVGSAADFGSGHDLMVSEFETHAGLCADSSEPGAGFRFCVSLSLFYSPHPPPPCVLSKIKFHVVDAVDVIVRVAKATICTMFKKVDLFFLSWEEKKILLKNLFRGASGWLSIWFQDPAVHGFESRIRLCAVSSEPGTCFGFCVSLSLCPPTPAPPPAPGLCSVSLSLSKINKR